MYRQSCASISISDVTGTEEEDDDENSDSNMEVQETEGNQLQQEAAEAVLKKQDAVDVMEVQ